MKLDKTSKKNKKQLKAFYTGLALIFYVMLLFLVLQNWHKLTSSIWVGISSQETTGTTINNDLHKYARENDRYSITYTFKVAGISYNGTDEISTKNYNSYDPLTVKYNPTNPSFNQTKYGFYKPIFSLSIIGAISLSGVSLALFYAYLNNKKKIYKNILIASLLSFWILCFYVLAYIASY
jgi:phosphotransferase system  glucose/maltose/N-acetylglucosamine-specific IIC component